MPAATPNQDGRSRFEVLTGLRASRYAHEDDGPNLAGALFLVSIIRFALVSVGLGLALLRQLSLVPGGALDNVDGWAFGAFGMAYGSCLVGVLALRQGSFLRPVSYALVTFDAVLVTLAVAHTGGAESVYVFTYVLVVLEGSVLLLRAGGWASLLGCTFGYALVLLAQLAAEPPGRGPPPAQVLSGFVIHGVGMALVALLASELATRLRWAGRQLAAREDELERLGAVHAAILEAMPAGVLTVAPDGRVRYANDSASALLRRPGEPLVGLTLAQLMPPVAEALGSAVPAPTTRNRREAEVNLLDGAKARFGYSLARFRQPNAPPGILVVFQDVTELVRLEEAARRAERLALVGRFAAGLAHEVRNPLASMCASVDVLSQSLELPPSMERLMGHVVGEAHRLEHLIRDFLTFARPQKLSFSTVALRPVVDGVLALFANDPVAEAVEVVVEGDPDVTATADSDLVRQVLWNVLRNGAEAMSGEGRLVVKLGRRGDQALVEVTDQGPGFSPEHLPRALDPFFTTKARGSGLGLAISQSIMHAHGGDLEVENSEDAGARIRLVFPTGFPTLDVELGSLTPSEGLRIVPSTGEA